MRVAVVGAGLSGLAAARRLAAAGCHVTIFEKSRGLGGRLASRRVGDAVVDHGAPALDAPVGSALAGLVVELMGDEAHRVDAALQGAPPADAPMTAPVSFAGGLTRLPKRMAEDLDVVRGVRIAALRAARGGGYELGDEQGNGHGVADAVVVSAPAPQAADLLERSPEPPARVAALRALTHHPAVMAVLGLPLDAPPPFFLAWPEAGPLAAVAVLTHAARPPLDGVVPVVARFTPEVSAAALDVCSDDEVLVEARAGLAPLLGADPEPAWSQVKRWRYATVARHGDGDVLNPAGARIVLCGDTISGPGLEGVYRSGLAAAERVLALEAVPA